MKQLIRSLLGVAAIALVFAACTTAPQVADRRPAAGAGTPGHTMPPAEHVDTSEGGGLILNMQRAGAGNSRF